MMIEFNPDGSIKLPDHVNKSKQEDEVKMRSRRCLQIERDIVSDKSPKKCRLKITLSDPIDDHRFINTIYDYFKESSTTPTKLEKIGPQVYVLEIGTDFRRCSDCEQIRNRYREFMNGVVIEKKNGCSYEGKRAFFSYEDHFD